MWCEILKKNHFFEFQNRGEGMCPGVTRPGRGKESHSCRSIFPRFKKKNTYAHRSVCLAHASRKMKSDPPLGWSQMERRLPLCVGAFPSAFHLEDISSSRSNIWIFQSMCPTLGLVKIRRWYEEVIQRFFKGVVVPMVEVNVAKRGSF